MLGFDTLVSVQPKLMADGVELTQKDIKQLLAQTEGLAFLKEKRLAADHDRLKKLLDETAQILDEISLMDVLHMELGTDKAKADIGALVSERDGGTFGRKRRSVLNQREISFTCSCPDFGVVWGVVDYVCSAS